MMFKLIMIIIVIMSGMLGLGYMHEQVHVEILRHYGIDSHVEYFSHFPNMVTISEEDCPTDACTLAHDFNEIIGYPLQIIYCVVSLLYVFAFVDKEFKEMEDGR